MAPRETENNAYAKFWGDKQRELWYVMVFLEWSIENNVIPMVLLVNMHLIKGTLIIFSCGLAGYRQFQWFIGTNGRNHWY